LNPIVTPKVVFVDHTARLSGAELALERLVQALDGHVEAFAVLFEEGPLRERLEHLGTTVVVLPMAESGRGLAKGDVRLTSKAAGAVVESLRQVVRMVRHFRLLQPDLVHANSLKAGFIASTAARICRIPCVWYLHDRVAREYLPASAVVLLRAALRILPSAVIANSEATRSTVVAKNVTVVHPSVATPAQPASRNPPRPDLCIGMIGRIARWKGQDLFLRAFKTAFPDGRSRAVIIGAPMFGTDEEAFDQELRCLVRELDLLDRVEFRGFQEDVAAELAELDIVVHASRIPEPWGQVVAEAMAAGVPVIASAAGGPMELIQDGVSGVLFPPRDVHALAAKMLTLAGDPDSRQELALGGRRRAREFSSSEAAKRVLGVYASVL
jgi:glycosyltransferase involved in cell wall biosynthesis